ncbi:MAG: carboxynorspermidine decarboxylase [Oscillospiraceae bacterium]
MINNIKKLPTPCYVIDEGLLVKNLEILKEVSDKTGAKILLAQKAFSMYSTYPILSKYLAGTTASSIFEARLGHEEMQGETHIYSPAYKREEILDIAKICDHIVFNSFEQFKKYKDIVKSFKKDIQCGIRINPEYSEIETDIYNPCFEGSRMGVTASNFDAELLKDVDGLHFHTMCEQNSDTLWRTVKQVDAKFGKYLKNMKWLNFGGGHHITRADYDIKTLIKSIEFMRDKYDLQIYLEPGEAVVLNTGFLVSEVLDTMKNGIDIAILDTSAACHMPDVLEMPYRPEIINSGGPNEKAYTYRLAAPTCLAGDVIGDYSFDGPLVDGDRLVFCDMALYTMVKNNTFNGINLPTIIFQRLDGKQEVVRRFGYEDFKSRL